MTSAARPDRWSADPAAGVAGGVDGPDLVRRLAAVALDAAAAGARDPSGPVPAGRPRESV